MDRSSIVVYKMILFKESVIWDVSAPCTFYDNQLNLACNLWHKFYSNLLAGTDIPGGDAPPQSFGQDGKKSAEGRIETVKIGRQADFLKAE